LFGEKASSCKVKIENFRDGYFPGEICQIKDYFESLKKTINPDLIFTHYRNDRHQDHRVISDLTWNTFRNHFILEYEIPKYDGDLGNPNFYVKLSNSVIQQKSEIIMDCFPSQAGSHWFDPETFHALARLRGIEIAVRYAEAFYAHKLAY
jgi:LmbE family N-acetylglucosaminyl deacetylase